MKMIAPPDPPPIVGIDDDGRDRIRLRLKQLTWSTMTVAVTAWFCTFGPLAAVLSVAVGKHILVAILLMGVGLDESRRAA